MPVFATVSKDLPRSHTSLIFCFDSFSYYSYRTYHALLSGSCLSAIDIYQRRGFNRLMIAGGVRERCRGGRALPVRPGLRANPCRPKGMKRPLCMLIRYVARKLHTFPCRPANPKVLLLADVQLWHWMSWAPRTGHCICT